MTDSNETTTNISGGVHGPVLSGNFAGPVTVHLGQPPQREKPPNSSAGVADADPPAPSRSPSPLQAAAYALVQKYAPDGKARAVDYADCVLEEPINWLFPKRAANGAWCEETWALELFFKGPDGARGGALFGALKDDPKATSLLDRIALLSLKKATLDSLLTKYPTLVFSINVTALTLADERWFGGYVTDFADSLRKLGAIDRVILEVQEHPTQDLRAAGLDPEAISRRLELLRHCPLALALDDTYSEGYVFQAASDSLGGRIAWQKMDWEYFQKRAVEARDGLRSGIRSALKNEKPTLVVEGVETDMLKGFLCEDVLDHGKLSPRIAIQSPRTRLFLPKQQPQVVVPPATLQPLEADISGPAKEQGTRYRWYKQRLQEEIAERLGSKDTFLATRMKVFREVLRQKFVDVRRLSDASPSSVAELLCDEACIHDDDYAIHFNAAIIALRRGGASSDELMKVQEISVLAALSCLSGKRLQEEGDRIKKGDFSLVERSHPLVMTCLMSGAKQEHVVDIRMRGEDLTTLNSIDLPAFGEFTPGATPEEQAMCLLRLVYHEFWNSIVKSGSSLSKLEDIPVPTIRTKEAWRKVDDWLSDISGSAEYRFLNAFHVVSGSGWREVLDKVREVLPSFLIPSREGTPLDTCFVCQDTEVQRLLRYAFQEFCVHDGKRKKEKESSESPPDSGAANASGEVI